MKAGDARACKVCGTQVSASRDVCRVCALRAAITEEASTENSASEPSQAGSISEPIGRRFENYELMLDTDGRPIELGRGVMGNTYKAFDADLLCPVTLKVISERYVGDQAARLRFLREARAAASVRDANVASVFHLGRSGGNYFYAMELVDGETLERFLERAGRLEVKLALEITTQVARGLAAIHKQKLVHLDIKPSNIMVLVEEESIVTAKIIDLGLSKSATGAMLRMPYFLALKAESLHSADRMSEALEAITEAEVWVERSEERWWCAELSRLRGEFLAALGAEETQIEASFSEAINIARQQKSVSLEKRAEGTYAEYRRQKASGSGEPGVRLPLW